MLDGVGASRFSTSCLCYSLSRGDWAALPLYSRGVTSEKLPVYGPAESSAFDLPVRLP